MLINERHAEYSIFPDSKPIETGDTVLLFKENEVLLRAASDASRLPLWGDAAETLADVAPLHAFSQGERRIFIADTGNDRSTPPGLIWENIRVFRALTPEMDAALLNAAWHLSVWYRSHRFCGACGSPLHPHTEERALTCENCGLTIYPSVLPAVIVAVTDGERLLLARNAQGAFRRFSLLAGFVEVGETVEQAVHREVLEEAGLRLKNVRYIASQPWGLSQSLMLGFTAELDGPAEITLQESELAEARWFTRGEVPEIDSTVSIAFDLMDRFRRGVLE